MHKFKIFTFLILLFTILFSSCRNTRECEPDNSLNFNADSAYKFVQEQVDFGPRVPNTPAHDSCAVFLIRKLTEYGAKVYVQNANVKRFDGKILKIQNIIGSYYPEKKRRVLLMAHWDSRFYADMEKDSLQRRIPIAGANDGASGVGVLLEIARQLQIHKVNVGVDIIFFDAEDQGEPMDLNIFNELSWSLGTLYWIKHPHIEGYKAFLGICLDMVGDSNATFLQEDNSRFYANFTVKRMWTLAEKLGYQKYFIKKFSNGLYDDNLFVSQFYRIRSINIIDNKNSGKTPFFKYWHTHEDTMDKIDKNTLKAAGEVVLQYLFCLK